MSTTTAIIRHAVADKTLQTAAATMTKAEFASALEGNIRRIVNETATGTAKGFEHLAGILGNGYVEDAQKRAILRSIAAGMILESVG
jgi:hypothetical protein